MNGPDYLTTEEQKQLDKIVDLQIDVAVEEKHLHEVDIDPPVDDL